MADERLAVAAEAIRTRDGFAEVRAVAAAHVPYADTCALESIRGDLPQLNAEQEARQAEIEEALADLEAELEEHEANEADEARIAALETELASIVERMPIVTDEQKAEAVAYVVIGADGTPRLAESARGVAQMLDRILQNVLERGSDGQTPTAQISQPSFQTDGKVHVHNGADVER